LKKKKLNIAIFGQGKPVINFYNLSKNKNIEIKLVITHKKKYHLKDINDFKSYKNIYENIFNYSNKFKIVEINKITNNLIKILKKNQINLIISCGSRFLFNKKLIKQFKHRLFNFHPSCLPEERGGANFTYRILNNKKQISATLHEINEKVDEGNILFQKKINVKKINNLILFKETYKIYNIFFIKLIRKFMNNKKIVTRKQKISNATKNLKITSYDNGAINWMWSIKTINNFIKAFGPPYTGAFTFINQKRVEIIEAKISRYGEFNEFLSGKIFKTKKDGSIIVYCKDGLLKIDKIKINDRSFLPGKILKLQSRFFTPINILDKALSESGKINFK